MRKIYSFFLKNKLLFVSILCALIPFIVYVLTLERKLVGGDTSSYAYELPKMMLLPPTGYPIFSMIGKIFSLIPIGELAFRLNMISAVFGSLTILFLFLGIYNITKNIASSFCASLCFAFTVPYWHVANRLEFDTLNSFIIALLIFAITVYMNNPSIKNLYFCSIALGLMLTNHPIAFFIMPAFLILIILIKPKIFKRLKTTINSILLFISPVITYSYVYIRSKQGFGPINTLKKLFYYVTGRTLEGEVFGGSFGDKTLKGIFIVIKDYLKIIYNAYGPLLIIICIAGFIFLLYRNWKFGVFTFLAIVFNLIITTQYLDWAVENYTLNILLIMAVYIGCGFKLILLFIGNVATRIIKKKSFAIKKPEKSKALLLSIILPSILFLAFPSWMLVKNYDECNQKEPEGIYLFWNEAFENMEEGSRLYVFSPSTNIAMFVNEFEKKEKNIILTDINSDKFSVQEMVENFNAGIPVYIMGKVGFFKNIFTLEEVGAPYHWERFNEDLQLYKVIKAEPIVKIEAQVAEPEVSFGKKSTLRFIIQNNSNKRIKIDSMELELPKGLKFNSVSKEGDIKENPGISRGMYMWVRDDYYVDAEDKLILSVRFIPERVGEFTIKFRVTTNDMYFDSKDLLIEVK